VFEQAGCKKSLQFQIADAVLDLYSPERRNSPVRNGLRMELGD